MFANKRFIVGMVLALTLIVGAAGAVAANPGEGVTVTPGKASWLSSDAKGAVLVLLLEELGYTVKEPIMFTSNPIANLSITQGDIDYWPSGWFPAQRYQVPGNFDEHATIIGTICASCALEGFLVDIPSIEKYDIRSLDDFKRPEVKEAFDITGDGKADLFGCPPGWLCHDILEQYMDAYDLHPHMTHHRADYTAMLADVVARIRAGEPTLFYTWAPNDSVLLVVPGEDVKWIAVPHIERGEIFEEFEDEDLIAEGLEHGVEDPLEIGFIFNDIHVVANNNFLEANPAAERLFEVAELTLDWINGVTLRISEGEDSYADILAMASEWIEENRDTVDGWLDEARAAAR